MSFSHSSKGQYRPLPKEVDPDLTNLPPSNHSSYNSKPYSPHKKGVSLRHKLSDIISAIINFNKRDLAILIGDGLEHFDSLLYRFLVPLLAPFLFPKSEPVIQLILAYGLMITSVIARPAGVFLFSLVTHNYGAATTLRYTILCTATGTILIGLTPIDIEPRWIAVLWVFVVRTGIEVCAAGEMCTARFFLMEGKTSQKAQRASQFCLTAAMTGIVLASGVATFTIAISHTYPWIWRPCFLLSGTLGLVGWGLRRHIFKKEQELALHHTRPHRYHQQAVSIFGGIPNLRFVKANLPNILRAIAVGGLGFTGYEVSFVFFNNFIPLITDISLETMMGLNTSLLIFDTILIPTIGYITVHYDPRKVMALAASVYIVTIPPLFAFLPNSSLFYVTMVRIWIITWSIIFVCPLSYWVRSLFETKTPDEQLYNQSFFKKAKAPALMPEAYFTAGMCDIIGVSLIGRQITPLCLWLWHVSRSIFIPGLYIVVISCLALWAVKSYRKPNNNSNR